MEIKFLSFFIFTCLLSCTSNNNSKHNYNSNIKNNESLNYDYELSRDDSLDDDLRLSYINKYLKSVQRDSLKIKGLKQKTYLLGKKQQYDSCIIYSERLKVIAVKNNDFLNTGIAFRKLGLYYRKIDKIEEAFQYHNSAFKNFKLIKDSIYISKSLLSMSLIQSSNGDLLNSKTIAIEGLNYVSKKKDTLTYVGLLQNISSAFRKENNYKRALYYNDLALNYSSSNKTLEILKNTRANILADKGEYTKAISILNSLSKNISNKTSLRYARIIDNLGFIYWKVNNDNSKSEQLLNGAKIIRLKNNDTRGLIASFIHFTKYNYSKAPLLALQYAEKAFKNAEKINDQVSQLEALDYIIRLKDNPKQEALLYTQIDKNLNKVNQQNRELYAVTRYENERHLKEKSILKAESLEKDKQNTWYLFGVITAFLTSLCIVIVLRNRHAKEKRKKVYETEKRISKRIHDELANDVYSAMMQLENDTIPTSEIAENLEDIYNKARDLSQEKFSFTTNEEFVEDLKKSLSLFSSDETNVIVKDLTTQIWSGIAEKKKTVVLLVLKELLVNMKKHSKATLVSIVFKRTNTAITINYKDNGIGIYKKTTSNGVGLTNAENRISSINGTFKFDTSATSGLKIKIIIPT